MSFESYIQQIRDIGKKAGERDFSGLFSSSRNQMALGLAEEFKAANRQQIQAEQLTRAQQQDRNFEMLGGGMAGEQRRRQDVAASSQRYNQAIAESERREAELGFRQKQQGDAINLQASQAEIARQAQLDAQQYRMQLAQYEAAQRQLDRDATKDLSKARNALEADSVSKRHAIATSQLKLAARKAQEDIAFSQQRRNAGGGGGMTASYSTGAGNFKDHLRSMGVMR